MHRMEVLLVRVSQRLWPHSSCRNLIIICRTKILLHVLVSSFVFQLAVSPDDIRGKPGIVTRPYVKSLTNGGPQMPIIIRKVADHVTL